MDGKIMELKSKRTLNSKHFAREDGKIDGQFHAGHIHYNDKLGGTGLRSIDWTLNWDDVRKGWYFNYHSFRPFLPEYADQWVEFRDLFDDKDQTIKYKAHASHVQGRLVIPEENDPISNVNYVIYDNAFGEGKDYILYFERSSLKKVVRVREAYKGTEEQRFVWDIDLPQKKVFRTKKKEERDSTPNYKLDPTRDKTFDTDKLTIIGNEQNDGKEWFTYLDTFKVWDSGLNTDRKVQAISVEYNATNKTLTKIVPALFLTNSVGDVFTDTTTSYYPSNDDSIYASNANWSTVRGLSAGAGMRTSDVLDSKADYNSGKYDLDRSFFNFDTSSLSSATLSSATISIKIKYDFTANTHTYYWTSSTCSDTVVKEDFDLFGTTGLTTAGIEPGDLSTTYTYVTKTFTDTSSINKTGKTKLGFIDYTSDLANSAPAERNGVLFYGERRTGTSEDPYLSITYTTASGPANLKTWDGLAKASVKTMNGLAIASVKTWDGLA